MSDERIQIQVKGLHALAKFQYDGFVRAIMEQATKRAAERIKEDIRRDWLREDYPFPIVTPEER